MIEIIPAILARSEEEFREKIERVRSLGLLLHIDVMDGVFVKNKTWADPELMESILDGIPFEAHLMVANPEHAVPVWCAAGAKRVFYHGEATTKDDLIIRSEEEHGSQIGIALNPETPLARLVPALRYMSKVMLMGVNPGASGQPFQEITIQRIKEVRTAHPSALISVDGGVKPENAKRLKDAGADILVAGSALTDAPNCALALAQFKLAIH